MPDSKERPATDEARSAEETIGQTDEAGPEVSSADGREAEQSTEQTPTEEPTSEKLESVQQSIDTAKDSAQKALPEPL